jgi:hypothetical protein
MVGAVLRWLRLAQHATFLARPRCLDVGRVGSWWWPRVSESLQHRRRQPT